MINKKEFAARWKEEYKNQSSKARYELDYYKKRIKRTFELNAVMHMVYNDIRGFPLNRGIEVNSPRLKERLTIFLKYYSLNLYATEFLIKMLGDNYDEYNKEFKEKVKVFLNKIE